MQEILKDLNKEQLEAVIYNKGPLLILAGAGTGKTKVLTSKIAYLIKTNTAYPSEILAVTFTNKAANEMKNRVASMIKNIDINSMWINTFHSIAARILRKHGDLIGLDKEFKIIDQNNQLNIIKKIVKSLGINHTEFDPKNYNNAIGKIKNNISIDSNCLYKLEEVNELYQKKLKEINSCDFDDLLSLNIKLFKEHKEIKKYYNEKFKYILVDEYQDTNSIQSLWLQIISDVEKNKNIPITCVGDDDQSIYKWRGAEIKNILTFTKNYKKAKILKLEKNYRSTKNILDTANCLIENNKNRHNKKLYSNDGNNDEKVKIIKCSNIKQEIIVIATEIEKLKEHQKINNYKDIGILVRANHQIPAFENVFLKYNIPYKVIGGQKFYEIKEIQDCIAYLRLIQDQKNNIAFERVVNVPYRYISFATIKKIKDLALDENISFFESAKNICDNSSRNKSIENLINFIGKINYWKKKEKNNNLKDLMELILSETNFKDQLKKEDNLESESKLENLEELLNILSNFNNIDDFLQYLDSIIIENNKNNTDGVNIITIHSAKGLEFDTVFLPFWQEGYFPFYKSNDYLDIEEERRLAYVAITRARFRLYITYSQFIYRCDTIIATEASEFIRELPEDCIDYVDKSFDRYYSNVVFNRKNEIHTVNDCKKVNGPLLKKCIHKKFGEGYIKSEDGDKLTILFKNYGEKIILKSFVEIINV